MKCLVIDGVSVGMLLNIPGMEKLNNHTDLGGQPLEFTIGRKSVQLRLEPDRTTEQNRDDEPEDKESTADSSTMPSAGVYEVKSYEDIVVAWPIEACSGGN